MDLFKDILGKFTGAGAAEGGQGLAGSVLEMLGNQPGGISGLLEKFQQSGLGDLVSSWIGTGANLPVSAEQVYRALGAEQIKAFAQKAGIAPEEASSRLSEVLPDMVDKLTPGGEVPQGDDLMSRGAALLRGLLSKTKAAP